MNKGEKIITPQGPGIVEDLEIYGRSENNRCGVILKKNPFSFSPVYYFFHEVKSKK